MTHAEKEHIFMGPKLFQAKASPYQRGAKGDLTQTEDEEAEHLSSGRQTLE